MANDNSDPLNDSPQDKGESSVSGSNPDPESDDNVLDNAHAAGLYENANEENPVELNIAKEIEKDENAHKQK